MRLWRFLTDLSFNIKQEEDRGQTSFLLDLEPQDCVSELSCMNLVFAEFKIAGQSGLLKLLFLGTVI